jgi:hypothetical protein
MIQEPEPADAAATPEADAVLRYENVVDGYHKGDIAAVVIDYFENRHPLKLPMERGRANVFAESIRKLIEGDASYRAVAITADVIRRALEAVIDQARSKTTTEYGNSSPAS